MTTREPVATANDENATLEALPAMQVHISRKMVIGGAIASRDWQPIHHDPQWAREGAGLRDVIMNNYTQAGWLSRFVTDWTGPQARLARMRFAMRRPLCPGDEARFRGVVRDREERDGLLWLTVAVDIAVGEQVATEATLVVALPLPGGDSPWSRDDARWRP